MQYDGRYNAFDLGRVSTYPLWARANKVTIDNLIRTRNADGLATYLQNSKATVVSMTDRVEAQFEDFLYDPLYCVVFGNTDNIRILALDDSGLAAELSSWTSVSVRQACLTFWREFKTLGIGTGMYSVYSKTFANIHKCESMFSALALKSDIHFTQTDRFLGEKLHNCSFYNKLRQIKNCSFFTGEPLKNPIFRYRRALLRTESVSLRLYILM